MDSFDELRAKVEAARQEYQKELEAHREMIRRNTGLPHPYGSQYIHRAGAALTQAQLRYWEAIDKLTKHVLERSRAMLSSMSSLPVRVLDDNMDSHQQHDRAIKLLEDKGHKVRSSDSHHVIIDDRSYRIRDELIAFVEAAYLKEWSKIEREYEDALRKGMSL